MRNENKSALNNLNQYMGHIGIANLGLLRSECIGTKRTAPLKIL